MLRWSFRILLATAVLVGPAACAGKQHTSKHSKKSKKGPDNDTKALVTQARESAKNSDYEAADKAYADAYEKSKDFDILEERVDFLIHSGRASKGVDAAKAYYDANVSDQKGYQLYAEALLSAERGQEALEVADQLIQLNPDEPAGHEKKGRALILLDKKEEGLESLRKAVQLDSASATYHRSLGVALNKLGRIDESALEFR